MKYKLGSVNYKQIKAIEAENKQRWLSISHLLSENSGIYILTREDEDGFKYAYVGQAKHILTRLAQHLSGYQHIDLSLKKHGLYSEDNPYGWNVRTASCPENNLDEMEQHWIKWYAMMGYQLRNKTSGSQGEGKKKIDDFRPAKGYRDGIRQGRINLARELLHIADKHLVIKVKPEKQGNKVSERQLEKFNMLLSEGKNDK